MPSFDHGNESHNGESDWLNASTSLMARPEPTMLPPSLTHPIGLFNEDLIWDGNWMSSSNGNTSMLATSLGLVNEDLSWDANQLSPLADLAAGGFGQMLAQSSNIQAPNYYNLAPVMPSVPTTPPTSRVVGALHGCNFNGCNKRFKRKSCRDRHQQTHFNLPAMNACTVAGCNAKYKRADKLTEHLWKKHADLGHAKAWWWLSELAYLRGGEKGAGLWSTSHDGLFLRCFFVVFLAVATLALHYDNYCRLLYGPRLSLICDSLFRSRYCVWNSF